VGLVDVGSSIIPHQGAFLDFGGAEMKSMARAQEALKEDYGISNESAKQPTDNRPAA